MTIMTVVYMVERWIFNQVLWISKLEIYTHIKKFVKERRGKRKDDKKGDRGERASTRGDRRKPIRNLDIDGLAVFLAKQWMPFAQRLRQVRESEQEGLELPVKIPVCKDEKWEKEGNLTFQNLVSNWFPEDKILVVIDGLDNLASDPQEAKHWMETIKGWISLILTECSKVNVLVSCRDWGGPPPVVQIARLELRNDGSASDCRAAPSAAGGGCNAVPKTIPFI
eukprot:TRINITY_DN3730_c0_g1_i1.p1 TRINITY_DN3730_c0_g1~~TRINITY_DN3730_c0_g1_i1.p1  ORF type:complete len:224 (-),score=30.10 TRINITY_DN3730_c0_g1_i1:53-724(-)